MTVNLQHCKKRLCNAIFLQFLQVLDDGRKQFFPGINPTSPHRMNVFTQYSDRENESQYFPSDSPTSNLSDNISTGINTTIRQHVHNIDE
jgi:hypothetical protein